MSEINEVEYTLDSKVSDSIAGSQERHISQPLLQYSKTFDHKKDELNSAIRQKSFQSREKEKEIDCGLLMPMNAIIWHTLGLQARVRHA